MVCTGSWRVKMESLTDTKQKLYKLWSVIMHIYLIMFVVSLHLGILVDKQRDLDKLIESVSVIILCNLILIKAGICQRRKVTEIVSQIEIGERDYNQWNTATVNIYDSYAKYTQRLSLFMFISSGMCGVTLVVTKFVVYIQEINAAATGLLNDTIIEKPLPYIIWRPVDETKHYVIAFILDIFSATVGCSFNSVTQIIFISLMTYISGQLIVLQNHFREYGPKCSNLKSYEEKYAYLRQLILEHKKIIEYVEELDDNMKYLMLMEFTINSFQITAIFYELLTFERNAVIIFRLTYLFVMVLQIFLLAWHANEISLNSIDVSQAIYESEWYDLPYMIKQYLLIIMVRAQRPLSISVGPFFNLTNSTAVTSMKAAYSYLALLTNSKKRQRS
ncbi:odorant receptor 10-like [Diabrotica undecimpunctata]|uniref:odorant receptor 10-like n=1 Tax=Diabrotica undecimpunctata TaxID=50387 RepID=UPI003B63B5E7